MKLLAWLCVLGLTLLACFVHVRHVENSAIMSAALQFGEHEYVEAVLDEMEDRAVCLRLYKGAHTNFNDSLVLLASVHDHLASRYNNNYWPMSVDASVLRRRWSINQEAISNIDVNSIANQAHISLPDYCAAKYNIREDMWR